jgi:hypothetical protein
MIVKEASYRALERRCLLKITDGTGAVEELPLELGGYSIPAHDHGRAQALQDLLVFLGERRAVFAVLDPLNRLIDMDCHPFLVFREHRIGSARDREIPSFRSANTETG